MMSSLRISWWFYLFPWLLLLQSSNAFLIPHQHRTTSTTRLVKTKSRTRSFLPSISNNDDSTDYSEAVPTSSRGRRRRGPIRRPVTSSVIQKQKEDDMILAQERHNEALQDPTLLVNVHYNDHKLIQLHPSTRRALLDICHVQQMTLIQSKTFLPAKTGNSILARAKTGTGKTLAALVPTIERMLTMDATQFLPGRNIGILVVAPTRELAIQLHDEANKLLTYHGKIHSVLCLYGGVPVQRDAAVLRKRLPSIVVATPGRLVEHIDKETRLSKGRFHDILKNTPIVILDEADRLLESFRKEIKYIMKHLPRPEKRQTLLFSATLPKRLEPMFMEVLPPPMAGGNDAADNDDDDGSNGFVRIDCVTRTKEVNVRVKQNFYVLPDMDDYLPTLVKLTQETLSQKTKTVIFFPTAKMVRFVYEYMIAIEIQQQLQKQQQQQRQVVWEIHSRMSQAARLRASTGFSKSKYGGVLLTSDVSARGVDYPDVTLVVQYGAPYKNNEELYLHRLGRTGRAGRKGTGLQILLPFEGHYVSKLKKRGVVEDKHLAQIPSPSILSSSQQQLDMQKQLSARNEQITLSDCAEAACRSLVAYYIDSPVQGVKGSKISQAIVSFADSVGMEDSWYLQDDLLKKLEKQKSP